ncbi:MAG: protein kinase [Planctomycetota bacterium]
MRTNGVDEDRLDSLFARLKPLAPEEREAVLARECVDAPELADRVRALLASDTPSGFLEPPAAPGDAEQYFGGGLEGERLGDFTLVRELGRGSMGVVYLAEQERPRRTVALKLLPVAQAQDPSRAERFRREAATLTKLDHPGIVTMLTYGEERGLLWYAMRYVQGHDLHQEIDRQRRLRSAQATPLPLLPAFDGSEYLPRMLESFCDLLDALQFAHDAGVVHRDVKPQNILVDGSGRFFLADFGLARDERFGTLTMTGAVQGTPHYMSPEQAEAAVRAIDHRTDVYSAGVVLYELLCLQRAFTGSTQQEILLKIGTREPLPVAAVEHRVPRDLAVVCAKSMEKKPANRYASAREFADDLRRFLRHEAILARPPSPIERAGRFLERHRRPVLAAALGAALLAAGSWIVQDLRFREVLANDESTLQALVDASDWTQRMRELVLARERVAALRAGGHDLPSRTLELVGRFEARLADFKRERRSAAEALLARGLGGAESPRAESAVSAVERADPTVVRTLKTPRLESDIEAAQRIFDGLATVFDDDEELRAARDPRRGWARLSIDLPPAVRATAPRASEARVALRRIDPVRETLGPAEPLGTLPIVRAPVPRGTYRIVVELPGFGFGEFTRALGEDETDCEVRAWVRPTAEAHAGLVRFDAATFRYRTRGLIDSAGCSQVHSSVQLDAFWIGEATVSNADAVRYLRETGARVPTFWFQAGYRTGPEDFGLTAEELAQWYDRPATGFSGDAVRELAEYFGARLPTHPELERTRRGLDGWFWPIGDGDTPPDGPLYRAFVGPDPRGKKGLDLLRIVLQGTRGVRDPEYRMPPEGLFHTFGNVFEWTDSTVVRLRGDRLVVEPNTRIVLGPAWASTPGLSLCNHNLRSADDGFSTHDVGVRLAKSDVP